MAKDTRKIAVHEAKPVATAKADLKAKGISGRHKAVEITLTRGVVNSAEMANAKKLPGKRKPPTLTPKRTKS